MTTKELEKKLLLKILDRARKVSSWAWDDVDPDAKFDLDALERAVETYEQFKQAKQYSEQGQWLAAGKMASA